MVSIVKQEKMLLAFATEQSLSPQDNEGCPSNLSSSTAGSSAATIISADDTAALQAATAQAVSADENFIGSSGEYVSNNNVGSFCLRNKNLSFLKCQPQQSRSPFTSQQHEQFQIVDSLLPKEPFGESQVGSTISAWRTTMTARNPIVDLEVSPSQDADATEVVSQAPNCNLSMRDMFDEDEAILQLRHNLTVDHANDESSMWFPLADDDDDPSDGANLTPNCGSGNQTPQSSATQKILPSPPSTLSQMSFLQERSNVNSPAPPLSLMHATKNADRSANEDLVSTDAAVKHADPRPEDYSAVRVPIVSTNTTRRPVLYSAIGSLENASLHSWNKRMLATAAKKASPFVTDRKDKGLMSSLLPPNQWVPLASHAPGSTAAAATAAALQPLPLSDASGQAKSPSPSSSSSSASRRPSSKQQSLASVLAAAEEAAKMATGAQAVISPSNEMASSNGYNETKPSGVPGLNGKQDDSYVVSSAICATSLTSDNPALINIASTQPQHPVLNSALRPSRVHHRARSEVHNPQRPNSVWGFNANDVKSNGRHVTMEESPATSIKKKKKRKKKVVEMFRPSCDAYTPRINTEKRTIKYKPAQERRAMMSGGKSEDMGTLSRPNFRDALRRVAMIVHQHVVKIEHRVEDQGMLLKKGLFTAEMREAFSEERFVTPRYKCTMVRVPMSRPGMVYGLRKIKVRYEIPTESEIYEFAHRLFQKVQLSSECSIVGLIYVERLMEIAKVPLLADTWRPIFLCGLLLASKVWQDLSSWNIEFASVYPQFSLKAIHQLELQFLRMVKWDLYISSSLYAKYYFALRSLVEKRDFRQRYNRMVGGVGSVDASEALKIQKRTELIKEEALLQLSRSM